MTDFDNSNSGVLFKNTKKHTEKHPDYTGSWTDANGVEHWLSAWISTSKSGSKYLRLSASEKKQRVPEEQPKDFDDSDVPF